jgi:flagellar biosynthetic protein FlhB
MADESFDEKTEAPTEKRRTEAREKGTVAKSTEVNSVVVLLAGLVLLKMFGPWMMKEMGACCTEYFSQIDDTEMTVTRVVVIAAHSLVLMLRIMLPVIVGILVVGVLANLMQIGFLFTTQPLVPNLNKINPVSGFGRLFSGQSLVETIKNIVKLVIIGSVAYATVMAEFSKIVMLSDASIGAIFSFTAATAYKIVFRVALVLIVLAVLDYAYQRYQYEKKLKMTKQEVKEEHKQMEGDPHVKSRVRSLQREMAHRRMIQQVPKATVVVTNPTHIAIALRYAPEESDAPLVVAKGKRLIAERIKQIANENGIPIIEDKPLRAPCTTRRKSGSRSRRNFTRQWPRSWHTCTGSKTAMRREDRQIGK